MEKTGTGKQPYAIALADRGLMAGVWENWRKALLDNDEAVLFELIGERWIGDVMPVNDPVGAVVYGMDTSNVDSIYVGGPARKQAGQLVGADPAASRSNPSPRAPASRVK